VTDADLAEAGRNAVLEGLRLWNLDIIDPKRSDDSEIARRSREDIDDILRAAGWDWEVPYKGDGQLEWCGLFVAACWRAAGLDPKWLSTYFSSTYRLNLWATYRTFSPKQPNPEPALGKPRRLFAKLDRASTLLPFPPQEGDILTIGDGNPLDGDHICLVRSFDPVRRVFVTIEGNGTGMGPDGKRRQGVVLAERRLGGDGYCARRLIRPSPLDLEPVVG
jgi:hypothetical protein